MKETLNNTDYDRIDKKTCAFIKGELPSTEVESFMSELRKKPELLVHAANTARLMKAMIEVGVERDQQLVDAFLCVNQDYIKNYKDIPNIVEPIGVIEKNKKVIRRISIWTSIAACALIVFFCGSQWYEYEKTTNLGLSYADTFVSSDIFHGEEEDFEKELFALFENVHNGNCLEETIEKLKVLYEVSIINEENVYTDYSFLIGWNLSIAYLRTNKKHLAIDQLKKMKESSIEKQIAREKVEELLSRLSE